MAVGADSIYEMDVLRHGSMDPLFTVSGRVHAGVVPALVHLGETPVKLRR